ncbi:hypothetical protein WMY93_027453 [Mugilogobius chulae]|uniref:MSP domain-containing protein n=1 Tax=Mugilogobius chulae TaxID=88201 RepID=A0AAW0N1V7_9GOBI
MLQPFEYDPNDKSRHKFMVMSMLAPDNMTDMETVWREAKPEELMDSRLKCTFEMPLENDSEVSKSTSASLDDGEAKKILEEYKRLQFEVQRLQDENKQMRENDGLRGRYSSHVSSSTSGISRHDDSMTARILCVVFFLVGLVVGKMLL